MLKTELMLIWATKAQKEGYGSGNSCNGSFTKKIKTENIGNMVLKIPRDRNVKLSLDSSPKGQRMSDSSKKP